MNALRKFGITGFIVLLLSAGLALAMGSRPVTAGKGGPLDVNSVSSDPSAYKGTIQVRGVVSRVSASDSTFVLIDIREYKACNVVTCATKFVPVSYAGTLPEVKEELVVTGEMVPSKNGFVLVGKELQRLGK